MSEINKKPFTAWTQTEVEDYFDLQLSMKNETLHQWLSAQHPIAKVELSLLKKLREKASVYIDVWNETDLVAHFISSIFNLIDFNQFYYSSFYERPVLIEVKNLKITGKVDLLIAKGRGIPKQPYFFLQEFKPEKGTGDAIAQVLLAMLFAQHKNAEKQVVLGGYVNGRNWHFIVLKGSTYSISDALVCTKIEDLKQIFCVLKELRYRIDRNFTGKNFVAKEPRAVYFSKFY